MGRSGNTLFKTISAKSGIIVMSYNRHMKVAHVNFFYFKKFLKCIISLCYTRCEAWSASKPSFILPCLLHPLIQITVTSPSTFFKYLCLGRPLLILLPTNLFSIVFLVGSFPSIRITLPKLYRLLHITSSLIPS